MLDDWMIGQCKWLVIVQKFLLVISDLNYIEKKWLRLFLMPSDWVISQIIYIDQMIRPLPHHWGRPVWHIKREDKESLIIAVHQNGEDKKVLSIKIWKCPRLQ